MGAGRYRVIIVMIRLICWLFGHSFEPVSIRDKETNKYIEKCLMCGKTRLCTCASCMGDID